jgi:trehalose 6-phosphate synthase
LWTAERLRSWLAATYGGESIVVLANREPFRHDCQPDGEIVVNRSAGGLVTALEPFIQACSGVWVAHGAGTADRVVVDGRDGVDVTSADGSWYRLRRVWLEPHEERGYYHGFANEGLWPLCHQAHVQPIFRPDDFGWYHKVNARFADAVCSEVATKSPLVLVQDYHFALVPQAIRKRLPLSTIVTFWHIPWPHPQQYAICPWGRQLLEGLIGSNIVGFQTPDDCRNFIDTVKCVLDVQVDRGRNLILQDDREVAIRVYPVSVEWPRRWVCQLQPIEDCRVSVCRQFDLRPDIRLAVGIDRLDYTKGIVEKCLTVERLLELNPELRERFALLQIAEPSRDRVPAYRAYRERLLATIDRINLRFATAGYRPIILLETHHDQADVYRLLRAADVCYVGSLHDGMNLVAKEFVTARDDNRGVLILSQFAGAARELIDALIVNPYAIDATARRLAEALSMTDDEQSRRMRTMRSTVAEFNIYRWAGEMMKDATRVRTNPVMSRNISPSSPTALMHA